MDCIQKFSSHTITGEREIVGILVEERYDEIG